MIKSPVNKPHPETLRVGALITTLVALGQISMSIYIPSLPALAVVFETTADRVNLTLALFLFGFAFFQLVYGPLSDRYGRRPVLLGGLGLYTIACVACAMALSIESLIVARFFQGVGACAGQVIGRAVVRDVYGRERAAKAMAYIGAALAISPALFPALGGVMQVWLGWASIFWLTAVVGVAVFVWAWAILAETNTSLDPCALDVRRMVRTFAAVLTSPVFFGHTVAVAGIFSCLMAFTAAAPYFFIDGVGLAPHVFGALSIFNVAGFLVGSLIAGRYALVLGPERMVMMGIVLAMVGGALMVGLSHVAATSVGLRLALVIGPMMIVLSGMGLVLANGMAGALGPFPQVAGLASGLMGFLQMAAAAGVSALVGRFDNTNVISLALIILVLALISFSVFLLTAWKARAKA